MYKLTIITVTYNAEAVLERTIRSVRAGGVRRDVEYLVIDGKSTDNTLTVIQKHEPDITHWLSEPDSGLYDAMNKGLRLAQGEYVWFINAGDEVHDERVIPALLKLVDTKNADVYYSDALFVDNSGRAIGLRSEVTPHTLPHRLTWRDMALGMKVCHQAFVVRRSIAPLYLTDNLSADVDWEIRCLKAARSVEYVPFPLCKYLVGGLSVQRHRESLIDRFRILAHHFGLLPALWNHVRIVIRAVMFTLR